MAFKKPDMTGALLKFSPSRGICLILALGMLVHGVTLLLPADTFATSAAFSLMAQLGSEPLWGGMMLFGGLTLSAGTWRRDIEWIRTGAFLGFVIWGALAIMGVITDPTGTGLAVRGTLALMHAYMWLQVRIHPELITGEITIQDLREYKKEKAHVQDNQGNKERLGSNLEQART